MTYINRLAHPLISCVLSIQPWSFVPYQNVPVSTKRGINKDLATAALICLVLDVLFSGLPWFS